MVNGTACHISIRKDDERVPLVLCDFPEPPGNRVRSYRVFPSGIIKRECYNPQFTPARPSTSTFSPFTSSSRRAQKRSLMKSIIALVLCLLLPAAFALPFVSPSVEAQRESGWQQQAQNK